MYNTMAKLIKHKVKTKSIQYMCGQVFYCCINSSSKPPLVKSWSILLLCERVCCWKTLPTWTFLVALEQQLYDVTVASITFLSKVDETRSRRNSTISPEKMVNTLVWFCFKMIIFIQLWSLIRLFWSFNVVRIYVM